MKDKKEISDPTEFVKDEEAARASLQRLEDAVNEFLSETGMSEDELADFFTIKRN